MEFSSSGETFLPGLENSLCPDDGAGESAGFASGFDGVGLDAPPLDGFSAGLASGFDDPETGTIYPNRNGDKPLVNMDPTTPNIPYFEFVDQVVSFAQSVGMYMALLPCWGDRVTHAQDEEDAQIFVVTNAHTFGEFLGNRYKNYTNIIVMIVTL